jgi:hypothetical protein
MKRVYLVSLLFILFLNTACTKITPKLSYQGVDYRLYYDFEANDAYNINFLDKDLTNYRKVGLEKALKLNLKIASIETKRKGFNYFVMTNPVLNNLEGFPINSYKELLRYITLHKRKKSFSTAGGNQGRGKWKLVDGGHVQLAFKPVGDEYKNSFISVWSADETLKDVE